MKRPRTPRRKAGVNEAGPPLSPLPPSPQSLSGAWRFALPLLLALYLVFAAAHAWFAPTGTTGYQNAPDEAAHMVYVRMVASGRLPTRSMPAVSGDNGPAYEWHQPPLYYLIAARFLPLGTRGVRWASILIGLAGLIVLYRIGRALLPDDPVVAVVATGIAALVPGHIAITSVVNNDGLLELWFSVTLLILIRSLQKGFTSVRAFWLGIALGAGLLTKATALLLAPLILFALLLIWLQQGEKRVEVWRGGAVAACVALLLSGWWFARNGRLYQEWLPLRAFQQSFEGTVKAQDVIAGRTGLPVEGWGGYFALVGQWTFQSFWAVYGTPQAAQVGAPRFLPGGLYSLMGLVVGAAAAGMVRLHFQRAARFTRSQRYGLWLLFATVGLVGAAFTAFIMRYFQAQGRYLYPALAPLCILTALGWRALFPARYAALASVLLLAFLAAFSLAFLRYVIY